MNMDIIKEGQIIDFEDGEGIVCFRTIKDGNYYINVAFGEEENPLFQVYQVAIQDNNVYFKKINDKELLDELSANWIIEEMKNSDDSQIV